MQSLLRWLPTSLPSLSRGGSTRVTMAGPGVLSARRTTDFLPAHQSVRPAGLHIRQATSVLLSDVTIVGRGTGLVRSVVLLMILLPLTVLATDLSKFLPPVRSGLGPVKIGCTIRGPSLQSDGKKAVNCGFQFVGGRIVLLMCPSQRRAWDVHLWANYLVYKTTPSGVRYVIPRTTWKRWYSRRWSRKAAYKDCRRFGESWKKHLKVR